MMNKSSVYLDTVKLQLPRVLSMLDREVCSKTYGCADRLFWSWKFIDFPGPRLQEISFLLSEIYLKSKSFVNEKDNNNIILRLTKSSIKFWISLQNKDGSFDEAYPNERSLAATAFTCFYVGQAYLNILNNLEPPEKKELLYTLSRAGNWLIDNEEKHGILSNHLSAAAAALYTIFEITHDKKYKKRSDYFIELIYKKQSKEGWFEEYGGADMGYETHTIFYLSYIWKKNKNKLLLNHLKKSMSYLSNFVHADGSFGGEYGSRNTRFYMPAGFEILSSEFPIANSIAKFMRKSILEKKSVSLEQMDTQNVFPLINNYCFALKFSSTKNCDEIDLPFKKNKTSFFKESGALIISNKSFQAIIGTAKGGTIIAISKNKRKPLRFEDAGYVFELGNNKKISSQTLNSSIIKSKSHKHIEFTCNFFEINQTLMSPIKFLIFRIFNFILFFSPQLSYILKKMLVKLLVVRKKSFPLHLTRKISWSENTIQIQDKIVLEKNFVLKAGFYNGRFSSIHMGSSRYFEYQELYITQTKNLNEYQIKELNDKKIIEFNKDWFFK